MIDAVIAFSARNRFLVLAGGVFFILWGLWCAANVPLDAIPDLSDTQVVVYSRWERSPDLVEDQVTYPIVTALLGTPRVKAVRGFSDFGYSYVYVIFEDGTDLYWARSRVLEYLSKITPNLPDGVKTELGPDATGVGWVYQYALVDRSGGHGLQELRSLNDWNLRYRLQSVPGVAEIAVVGGFVKRYQVSVDPDHLRAYGVTFEDVAGAVKKSNAETGGGLVDVDGFEHMVRGRGYLRSLADIESAVVAVDPATGTPILVRHVATVAEVPETRRGAADLDGEGDAVGGIVVMRHGENALRVIDRVKERLKELSASLPEGVEIVTTYDRSDLIRRAIDTLKRTLLDEMIVVSLVILLFLWHAPSAIVPIVTIPVSVIVAFIPFYFAGLTANIMSLSGIAISIGVLVDGAIVEVENAYKRLEEWIAGGRRGDFHEVRLKALQEVGPSVFFSLLVIAVAFMPVFALVDQEGRLFKPLALSKNLAMAIAAVLAVTLDPALRMTFSRMEPFRLKSAWLSRAANALAVGTYHPEEKHPVSRVLFRVYEPVCRFVLDRPKATLAAAFLLMLATVPAYLSLGSEFMPPLNEGAILYMPTTLPGISVGEAARVLKMQDAVLKSFPEVERVFGKVGRAETATDPAPFSMVETTVVLKPESEWRDGITHEKLVAEMDRALKIPGWTNAWTMPIKNRIDMLSTGIKTPVGIKIFGPELAVIENLGVEMEKIVGGVAGARGVFAERAAQGYFIDFELKRDQLARYGLSVEDAQRTVAGAIGGETVTVAVKGRERYGVSVRYARDFRDGLEDLRSALVTTPQGAQIPVSLIAEVRYATGPSMIRDENGLLAGYVYVDVAGRDVGGFVEEAKRAVAEKLVLPEGYSLQWSGQYENMIRVRERLKLVVPLTLAVIFLLLYLNTKSAAKTLIVMLAVPFSLVGAFWIMALLEYNLSIAAWVGMIALMGLDAETGVFMLLYLDLAFEKARAAGKMSGAAELREAIVEGAVKRIRPKMMTVAAAMLGLLPVLWSSGTGADMMKRIAAPMVGGLATSFVLELLIYPVIYELWRLRALPSRGGRLLGRF